MKKTVIRILAAVLLMALAMSMAACANSNIYDQFAQDGYTFKVRYNTDGAIINGTQNVEIVEVLNPEETVTVGGKTGLMLLAPDNTARGEGVFKLQKVIANDNESNNYFLAGWYVGRTPRVDENNQPLDAYGVLTSVSKRAQGYVFENQWDFATDLVDQSTVEKGEITLYAAWIPYFTYEIYAQQEDGSFALIGTKNKIALELPKTLGGSILMKDIPRVDGKVFAAAYTDEALTQQITDAKLDGQALFVDAERGIATQSVIKIYTTWTDALV